MSLGSLRVKESLQVQNVESARSCPTQMAPHHSHINNHVPRKHLDVIRTKFQVINNCREILGGLVSAETKIQLSPICRDYRHI